HAGKVIGGHEAEAHSRPYMVLLKRTVQNGQTKYCGGFLINEDFVMTAAHCQAKSYEVFLGLHKYSENHNLRLHVKQAFPHEYYNETDYTNDIMLLKLSSKAKWSKNVKPIVLAEMQGNSLPNACTVCGWGPISREASHLSSTLMEARVTLINNELCIKENVYCSEGEKGPSEALTTLVPQSNLSCFIVPLIAKNWCKVLMKDGVPIDSMVSICMAGLLMQVNMTSHLLV
ncbi:hypothetical protein XENOCAPTIV_023895, partial [Xenoophorus captivus]